MLSVFADMLFGQRWRDRWEQRRQQRRERLLEWLGKEGPPDVPPPAEADRLSASKYTVGFTIESASVPATALAKTAANGNGRYFESNDADQLAADIVKAINDMINKAQEAIESVQRLAAVENDCGHPEILDLPNGFLQELLVQVIFGFFSRIGGTEGACIWARIRRGNRHDSRW